jgi:hypothetical protein
LKSFTDSRHLEWSSQGETQTKWVKNVVIPGVDGNGDAIPNPLLAGDAASALVGGLWNGVSLLCAVPKTQKGELTVDRRKPVMNSNDLEMV